MYVRFELVVWINYQYYKEVSDIFSKYRVEYESKRYDVEGNTEFTAFCNEADVDIESISKELSSVVDNSMIPNGGMKFFAKRPIPTYNLSDYDSAPFFWLNGTGNTQKKFLSAKPLMEKKRLLCSACGLEALEYKTPIEMDTSKLSNNLMVCYGENQWLISERMKQYFEEWELTGFDLISVIHKGKPDKQQPVYQIVPKVAMPKMSDNARYFQVNQPCSVCEILGKSYMLTYNKSDLKSLDADIYYTEEYVGGTGFITWKRMLFSKRFRNLIYENKLSKRLVLNIDDGPYGINDWKFTPILVK